jgi:hypothetical protein
MSGIRIKFFTDIIKYELKCDDDDNYNNDNIIIFLNITVYIIFASDTVAWVHSFLHVTQFHFYIYFTIFYNFYLNFVNSFLNFLLLYTYSIVK